MSKTSKTRNEHYCVLKFEVLYTCTYTCSVCLFSKLWIGRGEGEASLSIALFQIQTNWCGEHTTYNACIIGPTEEFSPAQNPIGVSQTPLVISQIPWPYTSSTITSWLTCQYTNPLSFKCIPDITVEVIIASQEESSTLTESNASDTTYYHLILVTHQLLIIKEKNTI